MGKRVGVPRKPGGDGRRSNGGYRPGGGRPKNALVLLKRKRGVELADAHPGETPLDVMFDNMLFWHRSSKAIGDMLMDARSAIAEGGQEEFLKMLRQFLNSRENAQKCAVDCAPYMHARLASVEITGDPKKPLQTVNRNMTPKEAAEAFGTMLARDDLE